MTGNPTNCFPEFSGIFGNKRIDNRANRENQKAEKHIRPYNLKMGYVDNSETGWLERIQIPQKPCPLVFQKGLDQVLSHIPRMEFV